MTLSKISAALQRGEALTAEQCFFVRDTLLGREHVSGSDEDWRFVASVDGDPFTSVDAALAFVAEVFAPATMALMGPAVERTWTARIIALHDPVHAPTPPAAIMAAAIEAFLAKGGE